MAIVQVHRFRDEAAICVTGGEGTGYLTLADARRLHRALGRIVQSLTNERFGASRDGLTCEIPCRVHGEAHAGEIERFSSGRATGKKQ